MKNGFTLAAVLGLASAVSAHMEMTNPPPFRSKHNQYTTDVDYSMTNPLESSGSDFPCKGYQSLLGTDQGKSVADWTAGESYSVSLAGSATHNGGSCQASLSYDEGKTWKAIHSWVGACPLKSEWDFTVPSDAPSGSALFAWSWHNNVGNREMYMNCAHVTIKGDNGGSLSDRPDMFVAIVGNGCKTVEGSDVLYPNPGQDVTDAGTQTHDPEGSCGGGSKRRARTLRA